MVFTTVGEYQCNSTVLVKSSKRSHVTLDCLCEPLQVDKTRGKTTVFHVIRTNKVRFPRNNNQTFKKSKFFWKGRKPILKTGTTTKCMQSLAVKQGLFSSVSHLSFPNSGVAGCIAATSPH